MLHYVPLYLFTYEVKHTIILTHVHLVVQYLLDVLQCLSDALCLVSQTVVSQFLVDFIDLL